VGIATFTEEALREVAASDREEFLSNDEIRSINWRVAAKVRTLPSGASEWMGGPAEVRSALLLAQLSAFSALGAAINDEYLESLLESITLDEEIGAYRDAQRRLQSACDIVQGRDERPWLMDEVEERFFGLTDYLGDFEEAYSLALRILKTRRDRLAAELDILSAERLVSVAEHHLGKCESVVQRMSQSVERLGSLHPEPVLELARSLMVMSSSEFELDQWSDSAQHQLEAMSLMLKSDAPVSAELGWAKIYLSLNYEKMGNGTHLADALRLLSEAYLQFRSMFGQLHPATNEAVISIGRHLMLQANFLDSFRLLRAVHTLLGGTLVIKILLFFGHCEIWHARRSALAGRSTHISIRSRFTTASMNCAGRATLTQ
jgi:hypothetical protein